MKIGIIGAMIEEVALIKSDMENVVIHELAGRSFFTGTLHGHDAIIVLSMCGKVAAACTATILIDQFEVDLVVFTGVAGAVDSRLNVGDVVVSAMLYQHDLNAEPISPKFYIPFTATSHFKPQP
jgi:adenosylhomocysteine nucleosidase